MSWDVVLIRTKTNSEPFDKIDDEDYIPFTKKEITDEIVSISKQTDTLLSNLNSVIPCLQGEHRTVSFRPNPSNEEPYYSITLEIWGTDEPTEIFDMLKKDLNSRIFDMHREVFIDQGSESGLKIWHNHCDKIIENLTNQKIKQPLDKGVKYK